jgi:hypothetical protein
MKLVSEVFNEMVGDDPTGFNVLEFIRVETTTDAYQILGDGWSLTNYIKQHGDVEVEYDSKYKVYRVPAFRVEIEKYNAAKAEQCKIWGCE